MAKIKRYRNIVERFLSGDNGQRFFNFAYSLGAAVVILGALFMILHLPGGSVILCIGMCTEVLMFLLSAFDRPARDYKWEEVFPELECGSGATGSERPVKSRTTARAAAAASTVPTASSGINDTLAQMQEATDHMARMTSLLTESVGAISSRASGLGTDAEKYAEQMQALNRNLSGLNTIYEIQLKSVAGQLEAIENINRGMKEIGQMYADAVERVRRYDEESRKLTSNIEQLNRVYGNMLSALTVNMPSVTDCKKE